MRLAIALSQLFGSLFHVRHGAEPEGRLDDAEAALRSALRLDPNPGPYNTLAQVLRQKSDLTGSREARRRCPNEERKETELGQNASRKNQPLPP